MPAVSNYNDVIGLAILFVFVGPQFLVAPGKFGADCECNNSDAVQDKKKNDLSSLPPPKRYVLVSGKMGKNRVEDGLRRFAPDVARFRQQALATGAFAPNDTFTYDYYPESALRDPTWKQHLQLLNDSEPLGRGTREGRHRGGGFWFWKPLLTHHHLLQLDDGDFLVFLDSDNARFVNQARNITKFMLERNANMAVYDMGSTEEGKWSKGDAFAYFCTEEMTALIEQTVQYSSSAVILRKSPGAVAFATQWLEAIKNYQIVNDDKSIVPNRANFVQNRHDQTLLNLILKCRFHEAYFHRQHIPRGALEPARGETWYTMALL